MKKIRPKIKTCRRCNRLYEYWGREKKRIIKNNYRIIETINNIGKNKIIEFKEGYFSFAFNSEIALVIKKQYFILNCSSKLWDIVNKFMKNKPQLNEIIKFWLDKSKQHKISKWSNDFNLLQRYLELIKMKKE